MSEAFPDMSDAHVIAAPAKTNLWLRVLGKRDDGYHEIDTRMVQLGLEDLVRLKWRDDDEVVLRCSDPELPSGEDNLVIKAVRALERHTDKVFSLSIDLEKHIPSGAGLGGGSSDAAAVLRALNMMASLGLAEDELAAVGATIGSDIPFFIYDRPCDCRGRGEIVVPIPAEEAPPSLPIFLYKPAFGIAAAWAYRRYAESAEYEGFSYAPQTGPWGTMVNDLERPVFEKFPVLGDMKSWLIAQPGVRAALLSGSGSTMLAVLEEGADAAELGRATRERYGESGWTWAGRTA
jgi:4-diphosphocytidyl-2-C-methyl-D-erythritol kinase